MAIFQIFLGVFLFNFCAITYATPPSKKGMAQGTSSKKENDISESAPLNDTERNKRYREILKKNWFVPMPKGEYERLSRRFKGLSLFDTDDRPWVIPAISLLTPTGYSAKWGDVFASFAVNNRGRYTNNPDGVVIVGAGFGNPISWLGFELAISFLNVKKVFNSGIGFSGKISHTFPDSTSIAIGKIDFLQIPVNAADSGSSDYLAISRAFQLKDDPTENFSLLVVTLGIGDEIFKGDELFFKDADTFGLFGSASLRIFQPLNVILNWNQNMNLGLSVTPFRRFPLILSAGALDLMNVNNSKGVRFIFGVSYSDSVFSQTFPVGWFRGNRL
ncbi:MAG: hypothetical protein ACKOA8_13975 [Deltaproteobacteria bacterium]